MVVAGYRAKAKAVEEVTAGQGAGVAQAVAPTRRPDTAAALTEGTILLLKLFYYAILLLN